MHPDGLATRKSGPWVKRKHHYFRRYCDMFSKSMRQKWTLSYLDLMAGPGVCEIDKTGELLPGSPLIALDFPFDTYVFCEQDKNSAAALEHRVAVHEKAKACSVRKVNWEEYVLTSSFEPPKGLTLAFVDPTGISQVPWKSIEALAKCSDRIDILMTVQHGMGINLNRHQYLAKVSDTAVDAFLGNSHWRSKLQDRPGFANAVFDEYINNMKGLGFATGTWMLVPNRHNTGLYYICLFSRSKLAMKFWNEAIAKDESGQRTLRLE